MKLQGSRSFVFRKIFLLLLAITTMAGRSDSQTNPSPQQIPYTQSFGINWFTLSGLPPGLAIWTSTGAPNSSLSNAAMSQGNNDQVAFDSATVVKSTARTYGYSGMAGNTPINNGKVYIQTGSGGNGTDQIILSVNTSGYKNITISYDIEMINPQPKRAGVIFQYRIGTSGSFNTIDSSYWYSAAQRSQNSIDYYVNLPLPPAADNQGVVQLRWATARSITPTGGSSGLGFDNIVVNGELIPGGQYFRSVSTGNWSSISTWESSVDSINWYPATYIPSSADGPIHIRHPHSIITSGIANLVIDETRIDSGASLTNSFGTLLAINDGPGAIDLDVFGTFVDSSNHSVVWTNTSTWQLRENANFIKTTNTNSTTWQLYFYNGIANIPSTSNWICRKPFGATVEPSISTTNGGMPFPQVFYGNLYIENNASSWNSNNLCKFSGSANYPIIKGNFYVGGRGTNNLNFHYSNTNTNPVKVIGSVIINSGSILTVTGTGMEVQGNIISHGTYTHLASTSKLQLSGSEIQDVSGTGQIQTYHLEIIKSMNDVFINRNVDVYGNLKLVSGIVYTTPVSKIIVQNDGTTSNASNISYVNGPIMKIGDDAFNFPVGKLSNYQPIAMNAGTGTQVTDAFTAEYFHDDPALVYNNITDPTLNHISRCEYWTLDKSSGNPQKRITLSWNNRSCGVTNLSELRVARFQSTMWVNEGNSGTTGSVNAGTVTSNVTTGFGPFTLASTTIENPLPISLLNFSARYNGKEVKLDWTTASEINNMLFNVERSGDGLTFESIARIPGSGNSTVIKTYGATDFSPLNNVSYYRLKQTDYDGSYTYSEIIPIKINKAQASISYFESSRQQQSIKFDVFFPAPCTGSIEITDMTGKVIFSSLFKSDMTRKETIISMSGAKAGIYNLRISYGGNVLFKKFVY